MEKEFVPYKLAVRLKELGFYCDCFGDYFKFGNQNPFLVTDEDRYRIEEDNEEEDILRVPAPTFSQAFRWFREKHSLYSAVIPYNPKKDYYECVVRGIEEEDEDDDWEVNDTYGYSEAELACLDKLIEIVESK